MDSSELYFHSYAVHLGFWTNWSHGAVRGATITLSRPNGGFLIAFLAIYVGMAGKSLWRLACFCLHISFSSPEPKDGLYHQRQAILRNSDTAQDGAWRLLVSMMAWRRRARHPILRLLPLIIAALILSAAFGVASVFSSHVTTDTANEVLLKGDRCATLDISKANNASAVYSFFKPYHAQLCSKFLNYGLQCYSNRLRSQNADGCNLYTAAQLPLNVNSKAPCPFNTSMCKSLDENLVLDTGRLNSLKHFGINLPPDNQFDLRVVHECAPLVTEGFMDTVNDTDTGAVARVFYGEGSNGAFHPRAWTYEVPLDFPYSPSNGTGYIGTSRPEYNLGHMESIAGEDPSLENSGGAMWSPIPQLHRTDADVFVMFLSAPGIRFSAPTDDPWFSAHRNASVLYDRNNKTRPSWIQDSPINAMGCTMQVQFCNPKGPASEQCEPLRGLYDPQKSTTIPQIFPSKSQQDFVNRAEYMFSIDTASINLLVGMIGAAALRARYGLALGYQGPLPANQWQLEAEHWVKGELASMQDALVRAAGGPPQELSQFQVVPETNDTAAKSMCINQKIKSTEYSSFNVLGISLILFIGGTIVLLDMAIAPFTTWLQERRHLKAGGNASLHAVREWSATSTLQLQRLAHEEAGYGSWKGCHSDNPVTASGDLLATLDLKDREHLALKGRMGIERVDTAFDTLVSQDDEK